MTQLGTINVAQKMTGVKIQAQDGNGEATSLVLAGLTLAFDQAGTIEFVNQAAAPDLPAGSTFTVDIVGKAVSSGAGTIITAAGQKQDGSLFQSQAQIVVTANPNLPGPPALWVFTPGVTIAQ